MFTRHGSQLSNGNAISLRALCWLNSKVCAQSVWQWEPCLHVYLTHSWIWSWQFSVHFKQFWFGISFLIFQLCYGHSLWWYVLYCSEDIMEHMFLVNCIKVLMVYKKYCWLWWCHRTIFEVEVGVHEKRITYKKCNKYMWYIKIYN